MYLEHFGLTEPPFKITPITDFFFSGANRGEILDALIYAIKDGEGIVKVSGEVGSGKTMLCRMLLDKLPSNTKAIYLANPSMSRDELLYAIADRLDLNLDGQRLNIILQSLLNQLEAMYARDERCVVLVDEAHAMPLDTLEELRLLYNLQVGKHKLIQIVLFGQPELDEKLDQSNMRQLKDRIVHHFSIQPISRKVVNDYLMFRMRAAGYKGPDIFSTAAVLYIGKASQGLMRRVNILADKALLAAFVENAHRIEARHVQAAIRDSEMVPMHKLFSRKFISIAGGVALFAAILAGGVYWFMGQKTTHPDEAAVPVQRITAAPVQSQSTETASTISTTSNVMTTSAAAVASPQSAAKPTPSTPAAPPAKVSKKAVATAVKTPLLDQRLDATQTMLSATTRQNASIQLFYTDDRHPARLERFLGRAHKLGILAEIYIVPIKLSGKGGYRILYGHYADSDAALKGMNDLPQRYKEAFAPTLHMLVDSQKIP